jgi:putative hydrolase of the HAD superfamily
VKIRAVIFDVYGTLLQAGLPPADAAERWHSLFQKTFHAVPTMSLLDFSIASSRAIRLRHSSAQARVIPFPEILWPSVIAEVLPGFSKLDETAQAEFAFEQIQLGHTTSLMAGAGSTLRWLAEKQKLLGIASNAQAYSLRELEMNLTGGGLNLGLFDAGLCYWSYQHGFSKPDAHVFQILRARLEARNISPAETLMVGDRFDNDIEPAQVHGFQTWHLNAANNGPATGDWKKLSEFLATAI